jgi:hypothetical protein
MQMQMMMFISGVHTAGYNNDKKRNVVMGLTNDLRTDADVKGPPAICDSSTRIRIDDIAAIPMR